MMLTPCALRVALALLVGVVLCATGETPSWSYRDNVRGPVKPSAGTENCDKLVSEDLKKIIADYQDEADAIIFHVVNGTLKGKTYDELANFVDRHPVRPSGSKELEDSIDYMMERMESYLLEDVRGEQVLVPHWVRGEEKAELLLPIKKDIPLLGLGFSVGTSEEGITAPVLVVQSFDELEAKKDQVAGKIVVYNQGWIDNAYGPTVQYRGYGATRASNYGAVATLIESAAPMSLNTPHTGLHAYWDNVTHIPSACITKEDAQMLHRMQARGESLQIHLKMLDYNLPETTSRNVIGEIKGKTTPTEYVAVSGHIDSWDVGQGAMDDGSGVVVSVMALAALNQLNLRPKRTLQAILWTAEEMGLWGVQDFVRQHKTTLGSYSAVLESDFGNFKPIGLEFAGSEEAGCIVNEILKLMKSIDATTFSKVPEAGSDITFLEMEGVPGMSLLNENDHYFWYHHSPADTMAMIDRDELDLNTALWAVTGYVLADLPNKLPREVK